MTSRGMKTAYCTGCMKSFEYTGEKLPDCPTCPKKAKRNDFPCPWCKGEGSWIDDVLEYGMGPREYCGACDGDGFVVIGSKQHARIAIGSAFDRIGKLLESFPELPQERTAALYESIDKALAELFQPKV